MWQGAAGYADDLILLAPSRETMSKMIEVCENYAIDHNLIFSTDPVPAKSKTKCIYMCGKTGNSVPDILPKHLTLNGKTLPWVSHATHLGHEIHQSVTMELDTRIKRAQFIENCIQIREAFSFAFPDQTIKAVKIYALHLYGAMLWNFDSNSTGMYCRSWNTNIKLAYEVPRETHTYIVENCLATEYKPVVQEMYSRFPKFLKSLKMSASSEVQHLFTVIKNDVQSTTGGNIYTIIKKTGLNPTEILPIHMRSADLKKEVPEHENWRINLLKKYLEQRQERKGLLLETEELSSFIDSLCKA